MGSRVDNLEQKLWELENRPKLRMSKEALDKLHDIAHFEYSCLGGYSCVECPLRFVLNDERPCKENARILLQYVE
jgi:hypothetical protein